MLGKYSLQIKRWDEYYQFPTGGICLCKDSWPRHFLTMPPTQALYFFSKYFENSFGFTFAVNYSADFLSKAVQKCTVLMDLLTGSYKNVNLEQEMVGNMHSENCRSLKH